jgi:starvation-inducible DNA-binding protein
MTTASQVEPARYRDDRPPHRRNRADVQIALTGLLAQHVRALSQNEKFHRHVTGLHIRDYHLLLQEQATQILATTDIIAERVRKLGG